MERRGVGAAVAVALVMVVSVAVLRSTGDDRGLAFHALPEGVTTRAFGATATFVVKRGESVKVFLTEVHHLAGEDDLWWCPTERLFAGPTHGELFDIDGQVIGGPAHAGLDGLAARVIDGRLVVDEHRIIPGAERPVSFVDVPAAGSGSWDSGPSSFCEGSVRSGS